MQIGMYQDQQAKQENDQFSVSKHTETRVVFNERKKYKYEVQ